MKDFEDSYYAKDRSDEFSVSGTDGHYSVCYGGFNDWHVKRDGVRDEKLTGIMISVAGKQRFFDSAKNIANALRAQYEYEYEKPKKFEFVTDTYRLYQTVHYSNNPFLVGGSKHAIAKEIEDALGPIRELKCKVTIEEIK